MGGRSMQLESAGVSLGEKGLGFPLPNLLPSRRCTPKLLQPMPALEKKHGESEQLRKQPSRAPRSFPLGILSSGPVLIVGIKVELGLVEEEVVHDQHC